MQANKRQRSDDNTETVSSSKRQRSVVNGNAVAGPSNVPCTSPNTSKATIINPEFRCNLCQKIFTTSCDLISHLDMHTCLETQRDPEIDMQILQQFLNANIQATCKICGQSYILNKMVEHMIDTHKALDNSASDCLSSSNGAQVNSQLLNDNVTNTQTSDESALQNDVANATEEPQANVSHTMFNIFDALIEKNHFRLFNMVVKAIVTISLYKIHHPIHSHLHTVMRSQL